MANTQLSVNKLRQIHRGLPHGAITRVAKTVGLSYRYVYGVLLGEYFNHNALTALIEEYEIEKEKRNKIKDLMKNASKDE